MKIVERVNRIIDNCIAAVAGAATAIVVGCIFLLVAVGGWKLVEVFWRIWHYILQSLLTPNTHRSHSIQCLHFRTNERARLTFL